VSARRANVPSFEPTRGLMMPRCKDTREHNRQRSIEAERARNQQLHEDGLENDCDDAYFPSRPPSPQGTTTRRRFDGSPAAIRCHRLKSCQTKA
jgi:hypothetical protein